MRMTAFVLLGILVLPLFAEAQQPPYDEPPRVEAPYYRVRYEASTKPDELAYPVSYTIWIPPGGKPLRGVIVHQHGCGEGSCQSGQSGAFDLHWQALARKNGCALLAPSYEQPEGTDCQQWCDPRNGSDAAFQRALTELGAQSNHPELPQVPWALWGHSGGGHWAGGMVMLHPERVVAAWLRSGAPLFNSQESGNIKAHTLPKAALQVPLMCNVGTKEGVTVTMGRFAGVWPKNLVFFAAIRPYGGLIGMAVDPLTSHECGNQRYLAIPWLDACLAARLPDEPGQPLKSIAAHEGWVAPLHAGEAEVIPPVPATEFSGDLASSIWLPNQAVAEAWRQYIRDTNVADVTPPPTPDAPVRQGKKLHWEAEADLESGISHFIIECDGQPIATVPEKPANRFGRPLFQGLQYSDTPAVPLAKMIYTLKAEEMTGAKTFRVRAVNTVGLVSE